MKEFTELLNIIDRLLGPGGCPWDQKQTLVSTQPAILEEVYELIEAVDLNENEKIVEELGDLLFNIFFCFRLGEKENRFTPQDVLSEIIDKLIRRHPHVFGEKQLETVDQVLKQWEQIKKQEPAHKDRSSAIDGIPRGFPALARAQKMMKKISKTEYTGLPEHTPTQAPVDKQTIGRELLELVRKAQAHGIDTELALREETDAVARSFRQWEETHTPK